MIKCEAISAGNYGVPFVFVVSFGCKLLGIFIYPGWTGTCVQ